MLGSVVPSNLSMTDEDWPFCFMFVVVGTTANLGGALAGMGEQRLPILSAVTAYEHDPTLLEG